MTGADRRGRSDVAKRPSEVRFRRDSGQQMLSASFSAFDPTWTFAFGVALLRYLGALTSHEDTERPMYYQVISQCTQSLTNLETCLDKAEQHAAAKKFDIGVLMTSRLAPDMQHFIYQVESACDYVKAAAAWLSGQTPPTHEDNERTIDELRDRIRKTVAFAESVKESQYADARERKGGTMSDIGTELTISTAL